VTGNPEQRENDVTAAAAGRTMMMMMMMMDQSAYIRPPDRALFMSPGDGRPARRKMSRLQSLKSHKYTHAHAQTMTVVMTSHRYKCLFI